MQSKMQGNLVFVRLFPGENVHASLEAVGRKHKLRTAVIASGLGAFGECELGYFVKKGEYLKRTWKEAVELVALSGMFSRNAGGVFDFHLHASIGDREHRAWGGHLFNAVVHVTNEIALIPSKMKVSRKVEEATGLKGLYCEP